MSQEFSTKVALSSFFRPVKGTGTSTTGKPLLESRVRASFSVGQQAELAVAIVPSAQHLFGPRGVCLHPDGSFWVADTGHHRLLGWHRVPERDNQPADILIGQADFSREGRNAKSIPSASTCNVPTGICAWREGIALADPWNHRILLWRSVPAANNQPADIVLGQRDFTSMLANHGADRPGPATLHWPYGVSEVDGKLVVCDTGNRRVLIWDDPCVSGQSADGVLGQPGFTTRDENAGHAVSAMSMRWPHQAQAWKGGLVVADAGNNRIMFWKTLPQTAGRPCDGVLGQKDMQGCDHNRGAYYPTAHALNMPYAVAVSNDLLLVADTANSRLLAFDDPADRSGTGSGTKSGTDSATDCAASHLGAQVDFSAKGDNRWGMPVRDSLCWPYGLSVRGQTVAIADSGNNRVMLWDLHA